MFKMLKNKLKDQRGLTLIELLAVIVILGIIAAIAVPAIGNLISNTQNKADVAEGIQIINSAKLYLQENANKTVASPLTKAELEPYLENIETDTYSVSFTKTGSVTTYSITSHPSATLAGTGTPKVATEQNLLDY